MSDLKRFQTTKAPVQHEVEARARSDYNVKPAHRKPFAAEFTLMSLYWDNKLEACKSAAVWHLARRILLEHHRRQYLGGEIVLSGEVTGLPRETRARATKKMVELGLIKVAKAGRQAVRVVELLHMHEGRRGNGR